MPKSCQIVRGLFLEEISPQVGTHMDMGLRHGRSVHASAGPPKTALSSQRFTSNSAEA
jgi:hypothetical protein